MNKRYSIATMVAALLASLGCSTPEEASVASWALSTAASASVVKVGVLVDAASPAKANFTAAAMLAESQINQGLASAGIPHRLAVLVTPYDSGQAQNQAVDLINNQGVVAMVTDTDASTADVNRLNYDLASPAVRKVTVTCYQCSSPGFNDAFQTDLGVSDPDNWLYRTYYNASFETAVQVQLTLHRAVVDFNHDHFLKIVVYFDFPHLQQAFGMQGVLDQLYTGPHAIETVFKAVPSTPETRAAELAQIFDTDPDGHRPDAVYLALQPGVFLEALADYRAFALSPKPPAQTDGSNRRNFGLPEILAAGGQSLEGSSVLAVASSPSGTLFKNAFKAATGKDPELTASFLYDAVVAQAIAIGVAASNDILTPDGLRGSFPAVNTPGGKVIRPQPSDFKLAATRIKNHQPIDYDGASSPLELDPATGEMYPDLVHWKIQSGKFVEAETYRCDPATPNCAVR